MYDLANYLNEMCCDNAFPSGCGVVHFFDNWPTDDEIETMTRIYHGLETGDEQSWSLDDPVC